MKKYLAVGAVVAVLIAPAQIRAATIDFTFSNPSVPDTITGEIEGLTVGGTSSASAVIITGYTEGGSSPPFSFPTPIAVNTSITFNTFTLDGSGNLTAAHFVGDTGSFDANGSYVNLTIDADLAADTDVGGVFQYLYSSPGHGLDQTGGDFGSIVYTPAVSQTPLPAAFALFASGIGAMGLFGWRRKRKSAACLAAA